MEQHLDLIGGDRSREQVPLAEWRPKPAQMIALLRFFDALGDDRHLKALAEVDMPHTSCAL
jgi:hypothetical protein